MTFLECCEPVAPAGRGATVLALQSTTLLPNPAAPEMVIVQAADRRWLIADHRGVRTLEEGCVVQLQGRPWRFRASASPLLHFEVSQDEEHVWLEAGCHGARTPLGERVHHQCLLLLARERRADEQSGFAPGECGWRDVDAMVRMLGIDVPHLNIQVLRARRQIEPVLRQLGVEHELVERRRGQMRFGPAAFDVQGSRPERARSG